MNCIGLLVNPAVNEAKRQIIYRREGFRLHAMLTVCIFMQN